MKRMLTISLVSMLILTTIYIGAVYSAVNVQKFYWSGKYYLAILHKGEPSGWFYPEDLGIIQIIEKNTTSLAVSIPTELDTGGLETEKPIFKYKDKFYQIQYAELHWDAFPEYAKGFLIPVGALGTGWLLTGILFFRGRRKTN